MRRRFEATDEEEEEEKINERLQGDEEIGLKTSLIQFNDGDAAINPNKRNRMSGFDSFNGEEEEELRFKKKWVFMQLLKLGFDEDPIVITLEGLTHIESRSRNSILEMAANQLVDYDVSSNAAASSDIMNALMNSVQTMKRFYKESSENKFKAIQKRRDSFVETRPLSVPQKTLDVAAVPASVSTTTMSCQICMEDIDQKAFSMLLTCSSEHAFCESCMQGYIKDKINCSDVLSIKCPQEGCAVVIDDKIVNKILKNEEEFARYLKFKQQKQLLQDPDMRFCIGIGCSNTIKGKPGQAKLTCSSCGTQICYYCTSPWHQGVSCEKALEREYKDMAKMFVVKMCPKCRTRIQKNSGCNHMSCPRCSYQFCWLCLGKYSHKHYRNWNVFGCPNQQYSERLPLFFRTKIIILAVLAVLGILILLGLALSLLPLAVLLFGISLPTVMYLKIREDYNCIIEPFKITFLIIIGCVTFPINLVASLVFIILTCILDT